jgi:hypothetical protein
MAVAASPVALDRILAIQITVAWAGEGGCEPPRLGWWATDLTDPEGGGDFFRRLLPRTHAWASLGAVREAARRTDERARTKTATPDALVTLFHFGFEWDEALRERFEQHKRLFEDPARVFGSAYAVRNSFERTAFEQHLAGLAGKVAYEIAPGGRQLSGALPAPDQAAVRLAGALLPLAPDYPLPFYVKREGK